MATGTNTFDGVSFGGEQGDKCILFLQLGDLETQRGFFGNIKPKNADLPVCRVTPDKVMVTIVLHVNGEQLTYIWEKHHGDRIRKGEVHLEGKQLKVTLTKAGKKPWETSFVEYLQDI